ncbi:MAG: hypothetical protein HYX25_05280 [Candidatus Solibacter usitatus]|nr:hypothetical protein [Candidatus Solibacter usitatus]
MRPRSGVCGRAGLIFLLLFHTTSGQSQTPTSLKVVVLEGEGAINNVKDLRAKEPVVQVTDENDAPVKDATVTFMLPDSGPSGTFGASGATLTIQTDEKGQATGRGLRPNTVTGQFEIRVIASQGTLTARAAITQTNAAPAVAKGGSSKMLLVLIILAGAVGGGAAAAMGGKKSSSPASTPTESPTTVTPGTPVIVGPR